MKLSMEQIRRESQREKTVVSEQEKQEKRRPDSREEEELFGSVIQEIFP